MTASPIEDSEPSSPTTRSLAAAPGRRLLRRWLVRAGIGGVVAAIGLFWLAHHGQTRAAPAPEPPDAPRIEGADIVFSRAFAERAGVRLAKVVRAPLVPVVHAVGTVDFDPTHVAAIGARLRGLVTRVSKFEGDSVEPGTVLAVIESAELGEAQASVSTLQAEKHAADSNLERERGLVERNLSTAREAEVAAVEAERYEHLLDAARQKVQALVGAGARPQRLGAHELVSPIKGTVVERSVTPGQTVEGGLVAFRVANLDHLWAELEVFERHLALVALGDRVDLSPLAAPKETFEGRVARIGAVIDGETRSAPLRIEIDNFDRRLRAGQAVNARIHATAGGTRERTLVPASALTLVDGQPTLFVSKGEGRVHATTVELGQSNGAQTEVVAGVGQGDQVVSDGVFALKSELFR
jgi:cobalt-zinc-cadmium efflux system membrane fusion protein